MQINDYDATKSITTDETIGSPGADTYTTGREASAEDTISVLNNLIETCKDGQNGFQVAAEGVEDSSLKTVFYEYSQQRGQYAGELQALVRDLGGDPENSGSVAAAMHRGWINIKSVVTGKDDGAILDECERGEDVAKKQYQDAINANLPANVSSVVQKQAQGVKEAHDRVKSLRDSRSSASA